MDCIGIKFKNSCEGCDDSEDSDEYDETTVYETFEEIQQLENYNDIICIECDGLKLTSLPDTFPSSLQILYCGGNKLTSLPNTLPNSLLELWCSRNNLTSLPNTLPESLQNLVCNYNELTSLPNTLPSSLQILECNSNNLTSLHDTLPQSLLQLWCNGNFELTSLPDTLPNYLQILDCSNNKLISLPDKLPSSLRKLYCNHNKLTSLPNSIIQCCNLYDINYDRNEIEYIPPHLTRFLNGVINIDVSSVSIYNDGQNVHNHQIQESIRNSIYNVLADKPSIFIDKITTEIINSTILTEQTKRLIMEYCEDDSIHSVLNITFKELMVNVWNIIRSHKEKDNILTILNDEINDANCKCFTDRMSRLINCLSCFDDRVNITIADNSQIGNIIVLVR